jgi:hypothetical protein
MYILAIALLAATMIRKQNGTRNDTRLRAMMRLVVFAFLVGIPPFPTFFFKIALLIQLKVMIGYFACGLLVLMYFCLWLAFGYFVVAELTALTKRNAFNVKPQKSELAALTIIAVVLIHSFMVGDVLVFCLFM